MSKMIRRSALALTVATLAAVPGFASADSAEMQACFEAFTAEHLPTGPAVSLEVLPGANQGVQPFALTLNRTVMIDLTATHPETGEVLASAVCRIQPNGNLTITPAKPSDLLAAN